MKKIMFNDHYGLTEAVLSGLKTRTRRIVALSALDEVDKFMVDYYNATFDRLIEIEALRHYFFVEKIGKLPFKVGEVVAVAQSYKGTGINPNAVIGLPIKGSKTKGVLQCEAQHTPGWTNKMFVRADLMPRHIRITNARVESLQDISDEDCEKEGIYKDDDGTIFNGYAFELVRCENGVMCAKRWYTTPREAYAALIDKISGKGTWESNPYVFAYEFELAD